MNSKTIIVLILISIPSVAFGNDLPTGFWEVRAALDRTYPLNTAPQQKQSVAYGGTWFNDDGEILNPSEDPIKYKEQVRISKIIKKDIYGKCKCKCKHEEEE